MALLQGRLAQRGATAAAPGHRPRPAAKFAPLAAHAGASAPASRNVTSLALGARLPAPAPGPVQQQQQPQRQRPQHRARAAAAAAGGAPELADGSVSVVLLAGGVGKRMGAPIPKQYLELRGAAIATYSLATFARMRQVGEVVIVCDPSWRHVFEERLAALAGTGGAPLPPVRWALPGAERQDSVCNGLEQVSPGAAVVAVHDSARPLVTPADAARCMADGLAVGAAVLGVPVKPTIKEVDASMGVIKTLNRSKLWEVQTPQCIRPELLREGFRLVREKGLEVTDDVSIIEAMGLPVKITPGSYTNIKVTTPDDMSVAEKFMDEEVRGGDGTGSASSSSSSSSSSSAAVPEVQRTW